MTPEEKQFENEIVSLCNRSGMSFEMGAQILLARSREYSVQNFLDRAYPLLRMDLKLALFRFFREPLSDDQHKAAAADLQRIGRYSPIKDYNPDNMSFIVHSGRKAGSTTLCQLAAAFHVIKYLKGMRNDSSIVYWSQRNIPNEDFQEISKYVSLCLPCVKIETPNTLHYTICFEAYGRKCSIFFYTKMQTTVKGPDRYSILISDDVEWAFTQEPMRTPSLLTFNLKIGPGITSYAKAYAEGNGMSIEVPDLSQHQFMAGYRAIHL